MWADFERQDLFLVAVGERLLKFNQSCFSDTGHIYETMGDSYVSNNMGD